MLYSFYSNVWKLTYFVNCQPWYSQKQWHLHGFSLKFACIGIFPFKIFILDFKKALLMVKYFKCSCNKNTCSKMPCQSIKSQVLPNNQICLEQMHTPGEMEVPDQVKHLRSFCQLVKLRLFNYVLVIFQDLTFHIFRVHSPQGTTCFKLNKYPGDN